MSAPPRGRGYAMHISSNNSSSQPLRRPGESGLKQRFGDSLQNSVPENKEDKIGSLCKKISQMSLSNPSEELKAVNADVSALCNSAESLQTFVDDIVSFALKSKWNAHAIALFSQQYFSLSVENIKFRTLFLRKLQSFYNERNKTYLSLDLFLINATFMCEVFYHVTIDGNCIQVLVHPVIDYFCMLIDGGSQKEVEVFVEQFPKCFKSIEKLDSTGLDSLLTKIRKQLVAESISVTVRTMLLEIFESVLTNWKPLSQTAKCLYESLSKPIVRICQ